MSLEAQIKRLLDKPFWLPTLKPMESQQRFEDDSPEGFVSVTFTPDGDGWLMLSAVPDPDQFKFSFRFRTQFGGGGQSPRVRNALLILAEAIRLDNLDHPQHR